MSDTTYVSIPTEVEAMQWKGNNVPQVKAWMVSVLHKEGVKPPSVAMFVKRRSTGMTKTLFSNLIDDPKDDVTAALWVDANDAYLGLVDGEWIIKDRLGFYPCADEVFKAKYRKKPAVVKSRLPRSLNNPTLGENQ